MKIAATQRYVDSANLGEKTSFKIANNVQAFKILSDALYSDRITAICRELCTNAADSHVAAGNTNPYEVKLPNTLDPTFYVKDFGTGLAHNAVMTLFSTYFASDKVNSNSMVGGFGLGSKSPFSYCDSFTVISRFNGTSTTYNAFISDAGCPEIVVMCQEPCGNDTGLEIKFPVKQEDFNEFSKKLAKVVRYFKMIPTVVGNSSWNPITVENVYQGKGWNIRKNDCYSDYRECNIIMGGVAYPVNASLVLTKEENDDYYNGFRAILTSPVDIFMDIGAVAINPSRESLNYREEDVNVLRQKISEIYQEIKNNINNELAQQKTLWDVICSFKKFTNSYDPISRMCHGNKFNVTYNGESVDINNHSNSKLLLPNMKIRVLYSYRETTESGSFTECNYKTVTTMVDGKPVEDRVKEEFEKSNNISPSKDTVILYNDVRMNGMARVNAWRKAQRYSKYIIVSDTSLRHRGNKRYTFERGLLTVDEISAFYDGAPTIAVSSLPEVALETIEAAKIKAPAQPKIFCFTTATISSADEKSLGQFEKNTERLTKEQIVNCLKGYKKNKIVLYVRQDDPNARYPQSYYMPNTTKISSYQFKTIIATLVTVKKIKEVVLVYVKDQGLLQKILVENGVQDAVDWCNKTFFPMLEKLNLTRKSDLSDIIKFSNLNNWEGDCHWHNGSRTSVDGTYSVLTKYFAYKSKNNITLDYLESSDFLNETLMNYGKLLSKYSSEKCEKMLEAINLIKKYYKKDNTSVNTADITTSAEWEEMITTELNKVYEKVKENSLAHLMLFSLTCANKYDMSEKECYEKIFGELAKNR